MTEIDASSQLFTQATLLLAVGMGFVFAFLGFLIVVIKTVIAPLGNRFPDQVSETKNNQYESRNSSAPVIAAISTAISHYRKKHK